MNTKNKRKTIYLVDIPGALWLLPVLLVAVVPAKGDSSYGWQKVRIDDCGDHDIADSDGFLPIASFAKKNWPTVTAVCWDDINYKNRYHPTYVWCTYKNISVDACTGGGRPGVMYRPRQFNFIPPDKQKNLGSDEPTHSGPSTCKTKPLSSCQVGAGINASSGNLHEHAIDYTGAGPFPLALERNYNSQSSFSGGVGAHWSHSYSARLEINASDAIAVIRPNQATYQFKYQNKIWSSDGDVNARLEPVNIANKLVYNPTADFSIEYGNPNGVWSYGWTETDNLDGFNLDEAAFKPGDPLPDGDTYPMAIWGGWRTGEYPPHIWVNTTDHEISRVPPGYLTLHPGTSSQPSILRWTAPSASNNCKVSGEFLSGDIGSMQIGIRKGLEWIWGGRDSGVFNLDLSVNQTDTVDYIVYGGFYWGNTPLDTKIICEPQKGWRYTDDNDSVELYDSDGRLLSITNRAGLTQTLHYDEQHRLSQVTDPFGRSLGFAYDDQNRTVKATDPAGGIFTYSYDDNNNLTSVGYPDGQIRQYFYASDKLAVVRDENGVNFATYDYDSQGRAVSSEHADGVDKTTITYNADYAWSYVYDALGHLTDNYFGTAQAVLLLTDNGQGLHVRYDNNANISWDSYSNSSRTYDPARNLETRRELKYNYDQIPPLTVDTQWHKNFRLPVKISQAGQTTTFTYDDHGNLTRRTVVSGSLKRIWNYTYNHRSLLTAVDGPRTDVNDVTRYDYDAHGNLTTITDALGHATLVGDYDAHGRPTTIDEPNGLRTILSWDTRGRLVSRSVGDETTSYTYDGVGQLVRLTHPDGSFVAYTYDGAHRLTQVADQTGNKIVYELDAVGNPIEEKSFDVSGQLTQIIRRNYDELNRPVSVVGAQGIPLLTLSGGLGSRLMDSLGRTTELNSIPYVLFSSTDPSGGATQFGYDALRRLINVTDPRNMITKYNYDGLENLKSTVNPDTGTTTNTYDAAGNLITSKDARGKKTSYVYDALNRVTAISFPKDTALKFSYDNGANAIGRPIQMTDGTGNTVWAYDDHGRVISKTQTIGAITLKIGYVYDNMGRLTHIICPSGRDIHLAYEADRVIQISQEDTVLLNAIQYRPPGRVISGWTWGNGRVYQRSYDLDGRLIQYPLGDLTRTITYDLAGQVIAYDDGTSDGNWQFQYDPRGQLATAKTGTRTLNYQYDANGNRTQLDDSVAKAPFTYTYASKSNRLTSIRAGKTVTNFAYDAAGNTTKDNRGKYVYDDRGRMVQAGMTLFSVNGLGQRVKKSGATTTLFAYDETGHLLGEYDASGNAVQEFVYVGELPVAVLTGNDPNYVYNDHLGAPRVITDSTNKVLWKWDSEPFGSDKATADPDGNGKFFAFNLRSPGQYYDSETGLYYNYFRDYDPRTGRYLESDPVGLDGGVNTYTYAANAPTMSVDAFGLDDNGTGSSTFNFYKFVTSDLAKELENRIVPNLPGGKAFKTIEKTYKDIQDIFKNDPWVVEAQSSLQCYKATLQDAQNHIGDPDYVMNAYKQGFKANFQAQGAGFRGVARSLQITLKNFGDAIKKLSLISGD